MDGSSYHLACLLEDAPPSSLRGQFYPLATPLMTPLACIVPRTWQDFYRQNLGQPGVNYWEWRDKPESKNVCQELTLLLDLTEPKGYARDFLEILAAGKNPLASFYQETLKNKGKFDQQDFQVQKQIYVAFKQWHELAQQQIGLAALQRVYRVCYGASWSLIEEIFAEKTFLIFSQYLIDQSAPWWKVLGVPPRSNFSQVEQAYKSLVRTWHPDLNQHPLATDVTARINVAYEQYQALYEKSKPVTVSNNNFQKNPKLWVKIREWITTNRNK
ncbi:J domain-containing protein [Gloeothece verrucosa]|uniref:J domain-containing protein n=1 Tax=Gloeothece verrucosa TaxID=2546359 RepID=UPI000320B535|nr:J domain-containing protein [Gloeothece verrucosa]